MGPPSLKGRLIDFDDRDLAIVGLVVLAVCALFVLRDSASQVLTTTIAAIAGLAQGNGGRNNGNGVPGGPV